MKFTRRVKLVAPFWLLSACYFLIPFIRDPIQPPALLINIDNAIPFIWWMIIPYYFYYIALLLPLMITEQSKLQVYTSIAMKLLLISYTVFIIWPITCKAVLVFFSTFLAKQHFIADGITGLFLGFAGY